MAAPVASPGSRLLRRALWAALIVYWLAILTLTHLPPRDLPHTQIKDKVAHFLAYGLLGGGLYLSLWLGRVRRVAVVVLAVGLTYGALDEWTQPIFGRSCELADWLADAAAILVAAGVLSLVRWRLSAGHRR